jgi:Ca-activated chloride channel family protein
MIKLLCVSGVAALAALVILLSGIAEKDDPALYFNAAQAAYQQGAYEAAAAYYNLSPESTDKYINLGNAAFYLGEAAEDPEEMMDLYVYALQSYYEGILLYPRDIPLKYNYEWLKQRIEEMLENATQKNENQKNPENEENQENEAQKQDSEDSQESQESQSQDEEKNDESAEENGEDSEETYQQGDESDEPPPDEEAVERILMMLENQEEQSLKNNQALRDGEEGTHGW